MKIFLTIALFLLACSGTHSNIKTDDSNIHLLNDRTYAVFMPQNYDSLKTYGLILAFHGAYGNGKGLQEIARFEEMTDNYIIAYPNAKVENWEEGCMCNKPHRLGIDDIGFIDQLIDTMKIDYRISPDLIFAAGYSQGGLFSHNVGCKLSTKIKAFVSVASPMSLPLSQNCNEGEAISVLMIHGTADSVLPYDGDDNGSFSLISSSDAIRLWADKLQAKENPVISVIGSNQQIKIENFSKNDGPQVKLISIIGGSHTWSFNEFNTSQEIIDFFDSLNPTLN